MLKCPNLNTNMKSFSGNQLNAMIQRLNCLVSPLATLKTRIICAHEERQHVRLADMNVLRTDSRMELLNHPNITRTHV
jgi:hypothetical protein